MSYVINNEINIVLNTQGAGQVATLNANIGTLSQTTIIFNNQMAASTNRAASMRVVFRQLAVDLRMISAGLRVIGTAFGEVSPIIGGSIMGFQVLVAILTTTIGIINLYNTHQRFMTSEIMQTVAAQNALTIATTAVGGAMGVLTGAVYIVALVAVAAAIWDVVSGTGALRRGLKAVEQQTWATKDSIQALRIEQARANEGTSAYSFQIQALELAIERQGFATDEQISRLKSLKAEYASSSLEAASFNVELARLSTTQQELQRTESNIRHQQENLVSGLLERLRQSLSPTPLTPTGAGVRAQLGGEVNRSGAINVEAGEVVMQKEQLATMLQNRGGGGGISIAISLAGANINGAGDLEGAIARGGARARKELEKLNLMRSRR